MVAQTNQLLLDFPAPDIYAGENTLPLPEQAFALQEILSFSPPKHGLILQGEIGCGKTHLLRLWASQHGAGILPCEGLSALPSTLPDNVAVDGLGALSKSEAEGLFHLFNHTKNNGGTLLLATPHPPAGLTTLPDLHTRLLTLPVAQIPQISTASLTMLLLKWSADYQLKLEKPVVAYILKRAERSPARLRDMIEALNTLSLAEKRAVTVPLVRKILT